MLENGLDGPSGVATKSIRITPSDSCNEDISMGLKCLKDISGMSETESRTLASRSIQNHISSVTEVSYTILRCNVLCAVFSAASFPWVDFSQHKLNCPSSINGQYTDPHASSRPYLPSPDSYSPAARRRYVCPRRPCSTTRSTRQ